jgi:hypothetical protein
MGMAKKQEKPKRKPRPVASPDPTRVAAALKRVMPLVTKFPKPLQIKSADIEKHALAGAALVHRKKSSEEIGGAVVFGGDLVIDGSFDIGCVCIVLGDLTVKDVITREYESYLVVGGSIHARGIVGRGQLRAAGAVEAEVVFVETSATLSAGKGTAADLVILESGGSKIEGKLAAKTKIGLTYPDPKGLRQLEAVLHPTAFGTVNGQDDLYDFTNLEVALRRGKSWRRGGRRGGTTKKRGR